VTKTEITPAIYAGLRPEIADVVESARAAAARSVNALMTASYWEIGRRIVEFEQGGEGQAAYGEALIRRLGTDLSQRFGRGFGFADAVCNFCRAIAFRDFHSGRSRTERRRAGVSGACRPTCASFR
jgi:hypothetical protein